MNNYNYNNSQSLAQFLDQNDYDDVIFYRAQAKGFVQESIKERTIIVNTGTYKKPHYESRNIQTCIGHLSHKLCEEFDREYCTCPHCQAKTYRHTPFSVTLNHIPIDRGYSEIEVKCLQRRCPICGKSFRQTIPFKHPKHFVTTAAVNTVTSMMRLKVNAKQVSIITGIHRTIVANLDKEYLKEKLLDDSGKPLITEPCRHLGVDEWLLHSGRQYATMVMDLDSGAVLWLEETKTKQVIYDFMEHVGEEFMQKVQTVSCDMNADFAAAFKSKYPHIAVIFDRFHLIKNFNEMVVTPVRIATENKLKEEGRLKEAQRLKRSKYILTASPEVLEQKDAKAQALLDQGSMAGGPGTSLFMSPKKYYQPRTDNVERQNALIKENEQFACLHIIKQQLKAAYEATTENDMLEIVSNIISLCKSQAQKLGGACFTKFANLITNHLDGIVAYARHRLTSGKCEGVVNLIKTIRRTSFGYHDTDYFFLRIMSASRGGV